MGKDGTLTTATFYKEIWVVHPPLESHTRGYMHDRLSRYQVEDIYLYAGVT